MATSAKQDQSSGRYSTRTHLTGQYIPGPPCNKRPRVRHKRLRSRKQLKGCLNLQRGGGASHLVREIKREFGPERKGKRSCKSKEENALIVANRKRLTKPKGTMLNVMRIFLVAAPSTKITRKFAYLAMWIYITKHG